jgi:hypothetical protein
MMFAQAIDAAIVIAVAYKSLASRCGCTRGGDNSRCRCFGGFGCFREPIIRPREKHGVLEGTKQKVLRLRANDLVFGANDSQPKPRSNNGSAGLGGWQRRRREAGLQLE